MKFVNYDIRPCIEYKTGHDDHVESFVSEDEYKAAIAAAEASGDTYETFWTVYGLYDDGDGCLLSMAIGDFSTKKDAEEIRNAILN